MFCTSIAILYYHKFTFIINNLTLNIRNRKFKTNPMS